MTYYLWGQKLLRGIKKEETAGSVLLVLAKLPVLRPYREISSHTAMLNLRNGSIGFYCEISVELL